MIIKYLMVTGLAGPSASATCHPMCHGMQILRAGFPACRICAALHERAACVQGRDSWGGEAAKAAIWRLRLPTVTSGISSESDDSYFIYTFVVDAFLKIENSQNWQRKNLARVKKYPYCLAEGAAEVHSLSRASFTFEN